MDTARDYEHLSELDLARRAQARDPHAIRLITTRNNQRLFRAAWSVLRNRADAEEAVQDTYVKAFTGAVFAGPPGVPPPRYMIELFKADDLGIASSNKLFFRITAVGFGRSIGPLGRASITLQSVFSPQ